MLIISETLLPTKVWNLLCLPCSQPSMMVLSVLAWTSTPKFFLTCCNSLASTNYCSAQLQPGYRQCFNRRNLCLGNGQGDVAVTHGVGDFHINDTGVGVFRGIISCHEATLKSLECNI